MIVRAPGMCLCKRTVHTRMVGGEVPGTTSLPRPLQTRVPVSLAGTRSSSRVAKPGFPQQEPCLVLSAWDHSSQSLPESGKLALLAGTAPHTRERVKACPSILHPGLSRLAKIATGLPRATLPLPSLMLCQAAKEGARCSFEALSSALQRHTRVRRVQPSELLCQALDRLWQTPRHGLPPVCVGKVFFAITRRRDLEVLLNESGDTGKQFKDIALCSDASTAGSPTSLFLEKSRRGVDEAQ